MTSVIIPPRWQVLPDAGAVAEAARQRILDAASRAIAARGHFKLVLAGGRTPEQCYRLLAADQADWPRWEIFFGDERCLPSDHPERNSVMAARAWFDHVAIPAERVHPMPAEMCPQSAARYYAEAIGPALPFDLVLLGMGEDGHTASLFPGQEHDPEHLVHAVYDAPKPPSQRLSLSVRALSQTRELLILVTGAGKRTALRRWRDGEPLPVSRPQPANGVEVLLDRDAWGE